MTDPRDYERGSRRPFLDYDETEEDYEEEGKRKTPLIYRTVVWISVVVLLFALGYWGTSLTLKFLDKRQIVGQQFVVSDPDEAKKIAEDTSSPALISQRSGFDIFVPREGALEQQSVSHVSGLLEDDVKEVISDLLETMRAENTISEQVRVLHVFRNGDQLYLDLNDRFVSVLEKLEASSANLVMTSVVRSVVHNFSPVVRVRFLINGKDPVLKSPVDLTMPWQLKTSS